MKMLLALSLLVVSSNNFAAEPKSKSRKDCVDCSPQTLKALPPAKKVAEVSGAVQIMAAATQLDADPNEVRIKTYAGAIEISENPLNVVELKVGGQTKYLVRIEDEELYAPLKKGDLVLVDRSQFFVMDKNTKLVARTNDSNRCLTNISSIVGNKLVKCPTLKGNDGIELEGHIARDLDGNKYLNESNSGFGRFIFKSEKPLEEVHYVYTDVKLPTLFFLDVYEGAYSSIEEGYVLGKKKTPKVIIPKVKLAIGDGN
jgi:hypothetical protein